jgi:hypothetical protein
VPPICHQASQRTNRTNCSTNLHPLTKRIGVRLAHSMQLRMRHRPHGALESGELGR